EMTNTEVEESGKGNEEDTNVAMVDAEKTKAAKDDSKKAELPPISSSLSISSEDMDSESVHMVAASKVPMLKPGEFELWRMRIEQYILLIDYALWEVIENGNTAPKTTVVEGVEKVIPPTTAEEKA
ncbi:hypothetical protein Tco_0439365, partial [Tanacetum coccineum]